MADKKVKKEEKDIESFALKINVDGVVFTSPKLGDETTTAIFKMSNPTKHSYMYKIKCTSNDMFKIKTPVAVIKPDETAEIVVHHMAGKAIPENLKQYFAIYHCKMDAEDEKKVVRDAYKDKKSDGCKRIYISFSKQGGGKEKKDEGKDDKKDDDKDDKKDDKKDEKKDEDEKK